MTGGTVGWKFFDVESGLIPDDASISSLPSEGRGRVVVLAATPFAMQEGWAARAAVALATDWSSGGLHVFLMDLGLESPTLHEALGVPNGEGVSDAFLYGASVQHIANPVLDGAFFFAPAGSPPPDPEEVLGHQRWNDLAGGFGEADATLLLLLPTDIAGAGKILSRATDILFLGGKGESGDSHLGPASVKIIASMGPFGSPVSEKGEVVEGTEGAREPDSAFEASEPEAVAAGGPEDFGAGLDLAEGFMLDSFAGGEEEESDLDSSEELDLAGEFGRTEDLGFQGEIEIEEGLPEAPLAIDEGATMAPDTEPGLLPDLEVEGVSPTPLEGGFGQDLTTGAELLEGTEGLDEGSGGPPDFQADFADLGPVDEAPSEGGDFGDDLVQGPDFGGAPAGTQEPGPVAPSPPGVESAVPREDAPARTPVRKPTKRRKPPKKKFPLGIVAAVVVLLLAAGAIVGTAVGYFDIPGLTFLQDPFAEVPDPPLTLAGPQPNEEVLRFSLVLFTYDQEEIADAREMLGALRTRLPELLFVLVPSESDGETFYTLLAGPAVDRIEAEELRAPLSAVLSREDPDSWLIRETPRAFYLGERGTMEEAEEYMASLGSDDYFPYVLHVTYPDGSEAYEILAGAFEGVLDARYLQLNLRSGGFSDVPLIERRGRLPE